MKKFRILVLLLVYICILSSIMGCAKEMKGTEGNDGEKSERFVFALNTEPASLDPHVPSDLNSGLVMINLYETLIKKDENNDLVPCLAEDWSVSEDKLSWTFYLREGVKFHDGADFNAEAVKISLERLMNPENAFPKASVLKGIVSIDVVNDYEVVITTKSPVGDMLINLTTYACSIISPLALETYGEELGKHPSGTGPMRFSYWELGTRIVLVKNDEYWGAKPTTDELEIRIVTEDSTRVLMAQNGECDIAWNIPPMQVEALKAAGVGIDVKTGFRTIFLGMNQHIELFKNPKIREAICYAINADVIRENIMLGLATKAVGVTSTALPYSATEEVFAPYKYDVEAAKALLKEAGYPNGFNIKLYTSNGRYTNDKQIAEAIQMQLANVGINAKLEVMEWAAYMSALAAGEEIELYLFGMGNSTGDPRNTLNLNFYTDNTNNYSFVDNAELNALLDSAILETNMKERAKLLIQAQKVIHDNYYWVPIHYEPLIVACGADVQGIVIYPNETAALAYLVRN